MATKNLSKTRVGIVGIGFVGTALKSLFEQSPEIEVVPYDKYKNIGKPEDLNSCHFVFLCLPTPLRSWQNRDYDLSAIDDVLSNFKSPLPIVVVKSTVSPGTTRLLSSQYGRHILSNPEFLREQTAIKDMLEAKYVIVGGEDKKLITKLIDLYQKVYPHDTHYYSVDNETAELVKIAMNSFLATKVIFFNYMKRICEDLDLNYYEFREALTADDRIGRSHTLVTDEGGFSGHCLPKDLNALINQFKDKIPGNLLKAVWNDNCKYRQEYKGKEIK